MINMPEVKLGIVAVSRDCFPITLSENRRKAVAAAYEGGLYECPTVVESERDMQKALQELRQRSDVKWTFISPAGDFQADGARTGQYILGGEELTLNAKGESVISYADYAIAMVDEAAGGGHIRQRISVVRK